MKNKIVTIVFAIVLFTISLTAFFKPLDSYSESERRPLEQMPQISAESILSGSFMAGFEKYATDQFPGRDFLRGVKAAFVTGVLQKKDNKTTCLKVYKYFY